MVHETWGSHNCITAVLVHQAVMSSGESVMFLSQLLNSAIVILSTGTENKKTELYSNKTLLMETAI